MNLKSIILSGVTSLLIFTSCENMLREDPPGFGTSKQFYENLQQCEAGTNGCYMPLTNIYSNNLMVVTEALTDIVYLNNSQDDTRFDVSPSAPGQGRNLWTQCYRGIMYCNSTIAGLHRFIADHPDEETEANLYIGEASFLRALYYYNLTSLFGDVPFYTDDVCDQATLKRIARLPRMSAVETRDSLIKDLQRYAPFLPQKTSYALRETNRISAPAAYTLIAKLCLWNAYRDGNRYIPYYETAMAALKKVREIYGPNFTEDLYRLDETWFRNKNTKESIFEVQYTWSQTGLKKTTSIASMMTPTRSPNSAKYDGVEIAELGNKATINNSMRPTLYYISLFGPADTKDKRKDMILAYTYGSKWFSRPQQGGKPWMGPKFWCPGMDNVADGNNQKVFRYADVLLMIAECGIYTGEQSLAMSCLKAVKDRANCYSQVGVNSWPGDEQFLQEVKDERARELMGEYQRRFDLVRWGEYYDAIVTRTFLDKIGTQIPGGDYIKGPEGVAPETISNLRRCHQYYPIPDNEVVRTGYALDNKAYNEEGL